MRSGPCYPCVVCHRLLFSVSVIEIKDLEKFRADVNECYDNIFEETVHQSTPSIRGRYYICSTCKGYLFRGAKPPMSSLNKLEVFNNREYPDLRLTELEASMIARTLFFMKIYKLPRSSMSAIKDRCVCVPIDESTINKTLNMLPRTPDEAGLVAVKLKRKKNMKNVHLQEYVNVHKLFGALKLLKSFGHKYYQFDVVENIQDYAERCNIDDEVDSDRDLNSNCSNNDEDLNVDTNVSRHDDNSTILDDDANNKQEKSRVEAIQDEIVERENEEEHYLKNDAVGKFIFEYNKTTCMSSDVPEIGIPDAPITIAPGEGN